MRASSSSAVTATASIWASFRSRKCISDQLNSSLGFHARGSEPKSEINRTHDEGVGDHDVPFQRRLKEREGYQRKDHERNAFLEDLELRHAPFDGADAIRR